VFKVAYVFCTGQIWPFGKLLSNSEMSQFHDKVSDLSLAVVNCHTCDSCVGCSMWDRQFHAIACNH